MSYFQIGEKMLLFQATKNKFADNLVISAHGGIAKKAKADCRNTFYGARLNFYVEHGIALYDDGLSMFYNPAVYTPKIKTITYPNNLYYNYDLSKYQGRHNNEGETYDRIEKGVEYSKKAFKEAEVYDVLTMRNRYFMGKNVTLKDALENIFKLHPYRQVHCSFCRSFY
jgi:hypothetical protein